jgi:protein TonB
MEIFNETLAAERILSLALQAACVILLGWLGVKGFRNSSAPLRSGISILAILILFLLPLFHGYNLLGGTADWERQFPLRNEITIEVSSVPAAGTNEGFSLSQLPAWLLQECRTLFVGGNLVRFVNIAGLLWIVGILFFGARLCLAAVWLRKLKGNLIDVKDRRVLNIFKKTKKSFPRNIRAKAYISPRVKSPISFGIVKPAIVFPLDLLVKLSDSEIKGILLHELSHFYHRDHFAGFLQRLVTALYWWNPLVYSLSAYYSRAREEISDNHVLLENDSQEYAECLINLAESTSLISRMPVLTGLASPHIPLKDRVNRILSKERIMETQLKKRSVALIVAASIMVIGIVAGNRVSFATGEGMEAPKVMVSDNNPRILPPEQEKPPVRAKGEVKPPKLIKMIDPVYPEEAKKKGIEGVVIVEATTDIYGRVVETQVLRSIPELNAAALAAVSQWVYEPYIKDGEPRGIIFTVTVRFNLSEKSEKEERAETKARVSKKSDAKGKDVKQPKLIKKVDPVYPEEAKKKGIEGVVILEATTDIYGRVAKVRILKSENERLNEAAVNALKQWVYEPFIVDGKPLGVEFTVNIRFKLKDKKKK